MSKAKEIINVINVNEEAKEVDVSIPIPSFTIEATVKLGEYNDGNKYVQIQTFENNIEEVLKKVVPKAIADALIKAGHLPSDIKISMVGITGGGFPLQFYYKE